MNPYRACYVTDVDSDLGARYSKEGVAASSTDTYYSKVMHPDHDEALGFTLRTTGTLNGTFTLWYSDKASPSLADDTDWVQDSSWSPTNPAGSTTKTKYAVSGLKGRFVRVKYVNGSGTGNLFCDQAV